MFYFSKLKEITPRLISLVAFSREFDKLDKPIQPETLRKEKIMGTATNTPYFNQPRPQRFSKRWSRLIDKATTEQKDKTGIAFLTEIVGLTKGEIKKFLERDSKVDAKVGKFRSDMFSDRIALKRFWAMIDEIFPGLHTQKNIDFLVYEGGVEAAARFLYDIDPSGACKSPVLQAIDINAHAYK